MNTGRRRAANPARPAGRIGTATLSSSMGAVHIQLGLKGLKPGPHGLHVHAVDK